MLSMTISCLLLAGGIAAAAAPPRLPSLARINGLLDQARDLERKGDYAPVIPLYAGVLAECGEPAPRHLWHVAAKAFVQTGNAQLALGRLDEAQAAYEQALTRWGGAYETAVRQYVLRARALTGRIAEIRRMRGETLRPGSGPAVAVPDEKSGTARESNEREPLLLLTERNAGGGGTTGARGYEVRVFDGDEASLERRAEQKATAAGRKILETGRDMALTSREVLPGSCWDYIDAVFTRAGFGERKRAVVSKCPKAGPFLDVHLIQAGDWLYYRNHSFGDIEHSGIFVDWIQPASKVALILSYPGQGRQEPARFRPYELSSVFRITRPALR